MRSAPKRISEDCKLGKGESQYDEVKTPEELESFCGEQGDKVKK